MKGTVHGTGDKITDWTISFDPAGGSESRPKAVATEVPTVEKTAELSALGTNVSEILSLSPGETIQSFDLRPKEKEIVYCKVTAKDGVPVRWEIFRRQIDVNTPENLVSASAGVMYLDPTVDDNWLYYVSTAYGGQSLMRVPLNESMPTQLTEPRGRVRSPKVADGQIVYVDQAAFDGHGDVSVVSAAGGKRRVFGSGSQPVWMSKNKFLVYVDNHVLYRVDVGGTGHRMEVFASDPSLEIKDPALSPDDKHIAFAARTVGEEGNYDIYVLEIGKNQPQHVTALASLDDMPHWLNEHTLLFRSTRGKRWGIWSVELATDSVPEPAKTSP
jgi:Tol biopolymer transport system component